MRADESPDDILLVPSSRLSTEIVARTAVTVIYRQGDTKPEATVQTTSMEEIQENIRVAHQPAAKGRVWSQAEVVEAIRSDGTEAEKRLLDFTLRHSDSGQVVSDAIKTAATFGFYVRGVTSAGKQARWMLFFYVLGWTTFPLKANAVEELAGDEAGKEFRARLRSIFGDSIDSEARVPNIPVAALNGKLPALEEALLWIKRQIEEEATRRISQ